MPGTASLPSRAAHHRTTFALAAPLPSRSYCLQYRETDFDFIVRLLYEEGLAWRFEHATAYTGDHSAIAQGSGQAALADYDAPGSYYASDHDQPVHASDNATEAQSGANINSRSMAVDSELNIAHHNQHISKKARLDLWHIHTKGIGAQEDVSEAFKKWDRLIQDNKRLEMKQQPPRASLRGFLRFDPKQSDMD